MDKIVPRTYSKVAGMVYPPPVPPMPAMDVARARPISQATDQFFTEFEDDDSESEQHSLKSSIKSHDNRRHSDTTVSSYEEVVTPQTENERFQILIKPVEGPQGPHLFRTSQASAEFMFDFALQMSPLDMQKNQETKKDVQARPQTKHHRAPQKSLSPVNPNIPGLPENLRDWSSDDVVDWMFSSGIELNVVRCFRGNDITGAVLVDMQFEDLKDLGIQSFGKRHQTWTAISTLKGGHSISSSDVTPVHDQRRLPSRSSNRPAEDGDLHSLCSDTSMEDLPLDFVDCVGIEYTPPAEHKCRKGHACKSWQRWYKKAQRARDFSDELEGCISQAGNARNSVEYPKVPPQSPPVNASTFSEGIPSFIASSDVLAPGQLPAFAIHEAMLQRLDTRDPQENVKQFLHFQHVTNPVEAIPPTRHEAFEEKKLETFPASFHQPACAPLKKPTTTPAPHEHLRHLPRLQIPRAETASPRLTQRAKSLRTPVSTLSIDRHDVFSPISPLRRGTPASEMDIPVTLPPTGPVTRDFSQSVPPNMHYRHPSALPRSDSRTADRRRPSLAALPVLSEDKPLSPVPRSHSTSPSSSPEDSYGKTCSRAGPMKKRKTRGIMLWHEWREAHVRLHGTRLAVHADARQASKQLECINVHDYTVNCTSSSAEKKLLAKLKALRFGEKSGAGRRDPTAFAFQLVPERSKERVWGVGGRTHHFAVEDRNERLDWMRDLMLAKAKGQSTRGFSVQINGQT
ncbi:hypothetical protein ANO11243_072280 [Dothideomycetidae sp. 11243]|nr:hypothetical protein ANO11243_072280 [fungal sp. No.11243]